MQLADGVGEGECADSAYVNLGISRFVFDASCCVFPIQISTTFHEGEKIIVLSPACVWLSLSFCSTIHVGDPHNCFTSVFKLFE